MVIQFDTAYSAATKQHHSRRTSIIYYWKRRLKELGVQFVSNDSKALHAKDRSWSLYAAGDSNKDDRCCIYLRIGSQRYTGETLQDGLDRLIASQQ
jgi:hypothetical protein